MKIHCLEILGQSVPVSLHINDHISYFYLTSKLIERERSWILTIQGPELAGEYWVNSSFNFPLTLLTCFSHALTVNTSPCTSTLCKTQLWHDVIGRGGVHPSSGCGPQTDVIGQVDVTHLLDVLHRGQTPATVICDLQHTKELLNITCLNHNNSDYKIKSNYMY